ncbi:hypothetical protein [Nocardia sp. NPDC057455]|uniref:hypothetical protein n=1 Tax=Nocardia sp. NPDC057455 TaxID=3346138 RepID=UPI00366A81CC
MTRTPKAKKLYDLRVGRGQATTVPIDRVRKRLDELHALGLTNHMIARAAGVTPTCLNFIEQRNTVHTRFDVAARIFTVDHRPHPNQGTVLTIGARRRVRALNAIGWPTNDLAHRLGQRDRCVLNLAIGKPTMTYGLWARIQDLYNELSGTPGPSSRSILVAKRSGHVPPLAWDGIDIDDPRAQPDWAAAGIKLTERPVCVNNHPYTPANTFRDNRGNRQCRTCHRAATERQRVKRGSRSKSAA